MNLLGIAGQTGKPALPLARIKKLMKSDEDVRSQVMVSGEAPLLLCKAIELFTLDLTLRAWAHTDGTGRRTLQRSDIADAIATAEHLDFLMDTVPRDENATNAPAPVSHTYKYTACELSFFIVFIRLCLISLLFTQLHA
jgi:histone H3/H4